MSVILVNPTNEVAAAPKPAAARLKSLHGARLVLLDISKPGGSIFLDRLESILTSGYGATNILREKKPTFAKTAPAAVMERILAFRPDAVIEALAD